MGNSIGIDLGTTESTVSVVEISGRRDNPMEKLRSLNIFQHDSSHNSVTNMNGLQSSIYINRETETIYVGEFAKKIYSDGHKPLQTIRSVKTRIGGESEIDVPLQNDKNDKISFDMTELSSILLKQIRDSVKQQLGSDDFEAVTITIPAGFNSDERRATIEAGHLAGFQHVNLLDEPTAVLLYFLNSENSFEFGDEFFDKNRKVLVYDIGGGTLDISIANILLDDDDFDISILGRSERMDFGGDDIDKRIASYFLEEFEKINPSISARTPEEQAVIVSRIVSHAERHKVSLSKKISSTENPKLKQRKRETVNFEIIDGLSIRDLTLNDQNLREILSDLIANNGKLLQPLINTLKKSKLQKDDIDMVILTGGSGKFYLVEETLRKFFGNTTKIVDFTEREAVSKGASIHSYNFNNHKLKKIKITDVMSDSIFIRNGRRFEKLIPHDVKAPETGTYNFKFSETTKRADIFLYYGVDAKDQHKLREIDGAFITLDKFYNKDESIQLDWEFDENRIIKIHHDGKELLSTSKQIKENKIFSTFSIK
ncbi:molecular chaperone [Thiovulum sp. ES]|nr:molecular chaperone [Thiovulum sp. ES]